MSWVWLSKRVVLSIHNEQIAEHGGQAGLRDEGLLESALARPVNKAGYDEADVVDLAAAYGYGLARNHPFVDGNKRTSLVIVELFLALNGGELVADDAACFQTFMGLADGAMTEEDLVTWLRENARPNA